EHFPSDLENVAVLLERPDHSQETFVAADRGAVNQQEKVTVAELRNQKAVLKLSEGTTVQGIATDEQGNPVAGVTVKEGYSHGELVTVGQVKTGRDGRFSLPHRVPRQWIYTGERVDRATVSVVAQVDPGMGEVRLVMPPPRPWRIEIVDGDGKPLPGSEIT